MIPVVDGHNDALLRAWRTGESLRDRNDDGHLDLPRMHDGGIVAGFFAIFVPATDEEPVDPRAPLVLTHDGYQVPMESALPFERADRIARELAAIAARDLRIVTRADDLLAGDAILHLEGAEPIAADLSNLGEWFDRGLRSIGLVWSRPNAFGNGVPFCFPGTPDTGPGLTDAGFALVRACNELGVVIDLAHLNERGFYDVAGASAAPLVVSHTGANELCRIPRCLTNDQLDAVRDSDGVVGVVFDTVMTREDGELVLETPLETIAEHIEYIADRIGIAHVALGSDFDGCFPPHALDDASKTQALLDTLGWSGDELAALAHGNWLRVLRATWKT